MLRVNMEKWRLKELKLYYIAYKVKRCYSYNFVHEERKKSHKSKGEEEEVMIEHLRECTYVCV